MVNSMIAGDIDYYSNPLIIVTPIVLTIREDHASLISPIKTLKYREVVPIPGCFLVRYTYRTAKFLLFPVQYRYRSPARYGTRYGKYSCTAVFRYAVRTDQKHCFTVEVWRFLEDAGSTRGVIAL